MVATSGVVFADADTSGPPSIGRPISNATVLLLDEKLRPVRPGEAGELCLAGALVGRGYRDRPELTASRFVTYSPETGPAVRIYRTGDRARLLPNGEMAFLGRLDDQLKIRGYRIEPGEIVANLDRYPGIEASARSRHRQRRRSGSRCLRGRCRQCRTDVHMICREFLASRLPDYMIPGAFRQHRQPADHGQRQTRQVRLCRRPRRKPASQSCRDRSMPPVADATACKQGSRPRGVASGPAVGRCRRQFLPARRAFDARRAVRGASRRSVRREAHSCGNSSPAPTVAALSTEIDRPLRRRPCLSASPKSR